MLELVNFAIDAKIPFYAGEDKVDSPELRALLREAASNAVVLLKNDASLLPLKSSVSSIAVIGSNAKVAFPSGGGSASLASTYTVSPLEAIQAQAKEIGASVDFAMGAAAFRFVPLLDPYLKSSRVECFNGLPKKEWFTSSSFQPPKPDYTVETKTSLCFMIDGIPWNKLSQDVYCRVRRCCSLQRLTDFELTSPWCPVCCRIRPRRLGTLDVRTRLDRPVVPLHQLGPRRRECRVVQAGRALLQHGF